MTTGGPDLEALLVALVLAPATYSRNRFFELYKDPAVRRVRRRASLVRSVVRHLAPTTSLNQGELVSATTMPSGRVVLTYAVSALGLRRTTTLDPLEAALVRYSVARASSPRGGADASPTEQADRHRIEAALRRLAPVAVSGSHAADEQPQVEQDPTA